MEDRREYTTRVVVEFYVPSSAEDKNAAAQRAFDKLLGHLAPWDMPDHTIIDIEDPQELL